MEPVKLCVVNGVPVELRKQVLADLQFDTIGESVGFFRFDETAARRLAELVAGYVATGRANLPHEEPCAICCWNTARYSTSPT